MGTDIMQDDTAAALKTRWLGASLHEPPPLSPDMIARLSVEFDLPADTAPVVGVVLNAAARSFRAESRRAQLDLARCRKDLAKIEKAAQQLLSAIDAASLDAWSVVADAQLARSLDLDNVEATMFQIAAQVMQGRVPVPSATDDQTNLSKLRADLADLAEKARAAQVFAGAGKPGRPQDDAAFDLLHGVFHVWSSILARDFRLDWTDDGAPITEAARFCVAIARAIDPEISTSRIITAARKAREKGIQIRSLEELPEVMGEYRKRFE